MPAARPATTTSHHTAATGHPGCVPRRRRRTPLRRGGLPAASSGGAGDRTRHPVRPPGGAGRAGLGPPWVPGAGAPRDQYRAPRPLPLPAVPALFTSSSEGASFKTRRVPGSWWRTLPSSPRDLRPVPGVRARPGRRRRRRSSNAPPPSEDRLAQLSWPSLAGPPRDLVVARLGRRDPARRVRGPRGLREHRPPCQTAADPGGARARARRWGNFLRPPPRRPAAPRTWDWSRGRQSAEALAHRAGFRTQSPVPTTS